MFSPTQKLSEPPYSSDFIIQPLAHLSLSRGRCLGLKIPALPSLVSHHKWTHVHMSLNKLQKMVKDREAWCATVHEMAESDMTQRLNSNNNKYSIAYMYHIFIHSSIK